MQYQNTRKAIYLIAGICVSAACGKMDQNYKDIIKNGEIVYTESVDSLRVLPGKGRAALVWQELTDPKVTYYKIYWNNKKDSVKFPAKHTPGQDSVLVYIDNLSEGSYTFSLITGDDNGNTSVEKQVSGHVYGEQFTATLSNRTIEDTRWTDGNTRVEWQAPIGLFLGVDMVYTDATGKDRHLFIPRDEDTTEINDLKEGSAFRYRSLYLPDSAAIDTFYTDYASVSPLVETQTEKSAFQELVLPGDALTGYGWVLSRLWDDGLDESHGFFAKGNAFPIYYTFDMGKVMQLTRYKIWQRGVIEKPTYLYAGDNPSKWEIWGTPTEPDPSGSWDGWVKLLDCQSKKPSGLPVGQISDADKAYALAGEEFIFPDTVLPVRYIRVKVLATWGQGASQLNTMELTFWNKKQ